MRFIFSPPADAAAGLLSLPWHQPLLDWTDDRLVEIRQRGLSRHVVRFVAEGGEVYVVKELQERLARREYQLLRRLRELGVPAVEVLGVVVDRPHAIDAALVTRFLDFSTSYRMLFATPRGGLPTGRLLDAMVELLARLHLAGLMWGDCSLSNTLFRLDAGALAAYLVDAETAELHPTLSEGQRAYDVAVAHERVGGELFDLAAAGLLPDDVDPIEVAEEIVRRYEALWMELKREEVLLPGEQRYRIAERLQRLNELGFDVDELELLDAAEGSRLRVHTRVAEPGHHRRLLFARTGLDVPTWSRAGGAASPRRPRRTGGWSRCTTRLSRRSPRIWPNGSTKPRFSTRSSNTAGSCPRRLAGMSAPARPPGTTSPRFCPQCRTTSPWARAVRGPRLGESPGRCSGAGRRQRHQADRDREPRGGAVSRQ